jgi:hypothetical protein
MEREASPPSASRRSRACSRVEDLRLGLELERHHQPGDSGDARLAREATAQRRQPAGMSLNVVVGEGNDLAGRDGRPPVPGRRGPWPRLPHHARSLDIDAGGRMVFVSPPGSDGAACANVARNTKLKVEIIDASALVSPDFYGSGDNDESCWKIFNSCVQT